MAPSSRPVEPELFILVNGKRFDEQTGVKPQMNYTEIAALVGVNDRQVVRRHLEGDALKPQDVTATETVEITAGMKFLVERKPEDAPAPAFSSRFPPEPVAPLASTPVAPRPVSGPSHTPSSAPPASHPVASKTGHGGSQGRGSSE